MSLKACLEDQIGRLVHPTAQVSPELAAQHRFFIETRLALGFCTLAFVPLYLQSGSHPSRFAGSIVAWLMLPFISVALLSARGRLIEAEILNAAGWVGLTATLLLAGVINPGTAAAVLLVLPVEASLGESRSKLIGVAVLAVGACVILPALAGMNPISAEPLFVWVCVAYGALLCFCGDRDRRRLRDAMLATGSQRNELAEAVTDLVIRFDGAAATLINPERTQPLFGLDEAELSGRGFFDHIHVADRAVFLQLLGGSLADDEHSCLLRFSTAEVNAGAAEPPLFITLECRIWRRRDGAGWGTFAQVRKARESFSNPASVAGAKVDNVDDAWHDRFLANVSHELRTPLNAIIGFSEILASDVHEPRQAAKRSEYAEIIHTSGQHLLSVVNSMLDLSKIDAGKFTLDPEPFDAGEVLRSCCDMMRLKAEQARVDLTCHVEMGRLPVHADKRSCRQIVLNLLSNAIKFTPEYGQVSLRARLEGDWLTLTVTDSGIGILPRDLGRLGDPFFQAQSANDRRFEGTGLGLSVVSGLVGLQGGAIKVASAPGRGTQLIVRLPREVGPERPASGRAKIELLPWAGREAPLSETTEPKVKKIA